MSDVYKIAMDLTLKGNLVPELNGILRVMTQIERESDKVIGAIGRWHKPLQATFSQLQSIKRELGGLGNSKVDASLGSWAKELGGSNKALGAFTRSMGTVKTDVAAVSRDLKGWVGHIESAMSAIQRVERASRGGRGGGANDNAGMRVRGTGGAASAHHQRHGPGTHEARSSFGMLPVIGAPYVSSHYLIEGLKFAGSVDQIAEIQRVQGGLDKLGKPLIGDKLAAQIAENKSTAFNLTAKMPFTDPVENMKIITDLADLGKGDYAQARALLPGFARLNAITGIIGSPEVQAKMHEDGQMRFAARALDQMGVMGRTEAEQKRYFDALAMGTVGTRGIFNGKELFGAVQKSGGMATGWSPEFVGGVLPMLTEAMGGAATGDAMYMFGKHLMKGQTSNIAESEAMIKYGLQDKDNLINKKDFKAGSIIGSDTLKANPFEWFDKFFLPALAKKGITDHAEIDKAIDSMSFSKNYAKAFHEFNENHDNIKSNLTRFGSQGNLDDLITKTMGGQLVSLTESLKTFSTALGDPQMKGAITLLGDLTSTVSSLGKTLHDNPGTAQGAFSGLAAGVGGLAAAGGTALTIAAVGTLTFPALAIGSIAALTIGTFLFPWEALYKHMGWKPGIALGGKDVDDKSLNPSLELPGLSHLDERARRREAATQGLGTTVENVTNALKRQAELTGKVAEVAAPAASGLEKVGNALKFILDAMSGASLHGINFEGAGGGIGGMIQKASFGGSNDNGSVARALAIGTGTGIGHTASKAERAAYIKARAAALGIDPTTALRVAQSEGFNTFVGDKGTSFGDFQLHYGGSGIRGMNSMGEGDLFTRSTGLSAKDPKNWKAATDWALKRARQNGWGAWHGAGRVGIGNRQGIGTHPVTPMPPTAGPPPKQQKREQIINVHLGDDVIHRQVIHKMVADSMHPRSTGGADDHGSWVHSGRTMTDAA